EQPTDADRERGGQPVPLDPLTSTCALLRAKQRERQKFRAAFHRRRKGPRPRASSYQRDDECLPCGPSESLRFEESSPVSTFLLSPEKRDTRSSTSAGTRFSSSRLRTTTDAIQERRVQQ